ncbi:MAG TPA: phytanoyl-CoA dioxygenase family protein [Pyrinomonadaceae bacterium]
MNDQGFSINEGVFSCHEIEKLIEVLAQLPQRRGRAGTRHLMASASVAEVASARSLIEIAGDALRTLAVPFRVTLFEKTAVANWLVVWHQDTALPLSCGNNSSEWGPWSNKDGVIYAHAPSWALSRIVALRVHLDASTKENGPLRVIPGSHAEGVLTDEKVFAVAREQEPVDCLVPRGGVLAMRPLLIHSSSKSENDAPRRVLHIEYADSLDLDEGIQLAVA